MATVGQLWRKINLSGLQKEVDDRANELANRQDESEDSRKRLVELSRNFKQSASENTKKEAAAILKSFQAEVDCLSKRSRAAEAAFLDLYKKILEMPDPTECLDDYDKKVPRISVLEVECDNLRQTLDQYNLEFAEVKNQEVTIRQLTEKLASYEGEMEAIVQTRVHDKLLAAERLYSQTEQELRESLTLANAKLQESEKQCSSVERSLTAAQNELMDLRGKSDQRSFVHNTEVDLTMADLERANQRAETAERECELLREELDKCGKASSPPINDNDSLEFQTKRLEQEVLAKDKQISQLLDEQRKFESKCLELEKHGKAERQALEEALSCKQEAINQLEERLSAQHDYQEIRRELNIFKSVEFGKVEGDKSLEVMLLEKNKALDSQNTSLRLAKQQAEAALKQCASGMTKPCDSEGSSQQTVQIRVGSPITDEMVQSFLDSPSAEGGAGYEYQLPVSSGSELGSPLPAPPKLTPRPCRSSPLPSCSSPGQDLDETQISSIADIEKVINSGVPREIVEGIQIQNLQKLVGKAMGKMSTATPLDTIEIANHCKQLLAMYNIGQRLFAKCVLNQSQGALSELLAKPKPWPRLTEKGKDSFRKIYAWMTDDQAITILRSLSPKRFCGYRDKSNGASSREDRDTEARISAILNEAQNQMKQCNETPPEEPIPSTSSNAAVSPLSSSTSTAASICSAQQASSSRARSYRYRHDDIPKEMIVEIYQRELSKLKAQEQSLQRELKAREPVTSSNTNASTRARQQRSTSRQSGRTVLRSQTFTRSTASSGGRKSTRNLVKIEPKSEPEDSTNDSDHVQDFLDSVVEACVASKNAGKDSKDASPLHGMQSIANSITKFKTSPGGSPSRAGTSFGFATITSTRALKAVLPPITQDEFEEFACLSTEDVVKKVKEFLCQYSISQRLFGEQILGLSQGSVSDLLARPKPWAMLTQKGREPFIRMQMFLDDSNALNKLMVARNSQLQQQQQIAGNCAAGGSKSAEMDDTKAGIFLKEEIGDLCQDNLLLNSSLVPPTPVPSPPIRVGTREEIQEIANGSVVLDTFQIAEQIKTQLIRSSIGQRLFGEAILGLSQGSVSELLARPKPWSLLTAKGREPFIRMHLWMQDEDKEQTIMEFKSQKNNKRLHDMSEDWSNDSSPSAYVESTIVSPSNASRPGSTSLAAASVSSVEPPASKKPRIVLSDDQKDALRLAFGHEAYPSQSTLQYLSSGLGLPLRTVVNWFHNHRMRQKLDVLSNQNGGSVDSSSRDESSSVSADPLLPQPPMGLESLAAVVNQEWRQQILQLVQNLSDGEPSADELNLDPEPDPIKQEPMSPDPEISTKRHRNSIMERMQRSLTAASPSWEEEKPRTNILARIERHVSSTEGLSSETDWEF